VWVECSRVLNLVVYKATTGFKRLLFSRHGLWKLQLWYIRRYTNHRNASYSVAHSSHAHFLLSVLIVPCPKRLAAGFSTLISRFILRAVLTRFLVDQVTLWQVFLRVLRMSLAGPFYQSSTFVHLSSGRTMWALEATVVQTHSVAAQYERSTFPLHCGTSSKHTDRYIKKL
jgi:hypothetical protein